MKIKIIGLGNIFAGDDAVGNLVARQLLPYQNPSVSINEGGLAGLTLLYEMEGTDKLILVDGVSSHSEPGTIFRFIIPQDFEKIAKLAWSSSTFSTHSFGLGEALALAKTLDLLPPQVILYGLELGHIHSGNPLSPQMSRSLQSVVDRIVTGELTQAPCTNSN
jgi:hydrogenase maturation protease